MNKELTVAKVSVPLPIDRLFDYSIPEALLGIIQDGMRVNILFNRKKTTGYIVSRCTKSKIKNLNPILETIDQTSVLTVSSLQLAKKIKDYYLCSLGEAIEIMLPGVLKHSKNIKAFFSFSDSLKEKKKRSKIVYVQDILKTNTLNFFKEETLKRIKDKKRVIFVVPELEMIKSISEYFANICDIKIGVWHGKLSKNKMLGLWEAIGNDKIDMIIGTRSCVFAPLKNLDLIIIKDEDNFSYKDDQVPYYHTVKIAQMRSEIEHCDIILSSVTPSLRTYQLILNKEILFKNPENTKSLAMIQKMEINYKDKINVMLEKEISKALENKERILILLNRRGFATFIYCKKCNETLKCNRCSSNLRFDYSQKLLKCPSCSYKSELLEICPKCNSAYVKYGGLGIEKLESILKRNFPLAKIITTDELIKTNTKATNYDIVIATKKVLNLQDFNSDITIIWDLDSFLNIGDFHSGEETYQFLSKLLLMTTKKMIICSSLNQEYYLLKNLEGLKFNEFNENELKIRRELKLPPYYHLGLISIRGFDKITVQNTSSRLFLTLKRFTTKDISVSNLYTNLRSRLREKFYSYIWVKSKDVDLLNKTIKKRLKKFRGNKIIITVNIDPI